jgi:hypothetical protein
MKPTDAPNSNFIGITTLHVSGSLSARQQDGTALQFHPAPDSNGHQICKNVPMPMYG